MPDLIEGIVLSDKISVPSQRQLTDAGQLIVPCAFARIGVQLYSAKSLGLVDEAPDSMIQVHRLEEDVFHEDSMGTFRSSPVTIGHPKDDAGIAITVTADNAKDIQVGMLEGMPVRDDNLMTGTLVITNQEAIDSIESGEQELSAGYTCDIECTDGIYYQRNIKANHIAIVAKGRAGSNCAIADEEEKPAKEPMVKPAKAVKRNSAKAKTPEQVAAKNVENKANEPVVEPVAKSITDPVEPTAPVSKAKSTYTKHTVDHLISMMDESMAVEAAEYVALYEENETSRMEDEAQWYSDMAEKLKARATAHAAVAEAAHKIAKKVGKAMKDEDDLVEQIQLILDDADQLQIQLTAMCDMNEAQVESRTNTIIAAKLLSDVTEFKGKTELEIKKLVLDDAGIVYAERTDAYIEARFDVLCEDSNEETPMTELQRKTVNDTVTPTVYVDPVKAARKRMVDTQTKKGK